MGIDFAMHTPDSSQKSVGQVLHPAGGQPGRASRQEKSGVHSPEAGTQCSQHSLRFHATAPTAEAGYCWSPKLPLSLSCNHMKSFYTLHHFLSPAEIKAWCCQHAQSVTVLHLIASMKKQKQKNEV